MRSQYLACLLLAGLAFGQAVPASPSAAKPAPSASSAPEKPAETKPGPDDAVITLKDFCSDETRHGDTCTTTITRAQFEKLADALQPNMTPAIRRNLANNYGRLLKMSKTAEKRELDRAPQFEELIQYARLQILSQELTRALQEDASKVSDEDIESYYEKNKASFEQGTFARIFVPRSKQIINPEPIAAKNAETNGKPVPNNAPTEEQRKASEEAMTKVAADLRSRAVKGEDPDALQKEAYADAGLPGNPMQTKMEKVRRTTLPVTHQPVMDLKVGEVSEVISEPNGGHYIYKLISKETLPIDSVKTEIRNMISSQRYRASMQEFSGNVELNDAYFGPTRNPAMPPRPRGARPSDQPAADPD